MKPDFNDSSSRGVMVGIDRGVGAGGMSKSNSDNFDGDRIDWRMFLIGERLGE
jgi:hypothetical protein